MTRELCNTPWTFGVDRESKGDLYCPPPPPPSTPAPRPLPAPSLLAGGNVMLGFSSQRASQRTARSADREGTKSLTSALYRTAIGDKTSDTTHTRKTITYIRPFKKGFFILFILMHMAICCVCLRIQLPATCPCSSRSALRSPTLLRPCRGGSWE